MGDQARTSVHYRDRTEQGKAVLETDELVFRGDDGLRLRVPFKEMERWGSDGRNLTVWYKGEEIILELGPISGKWFHKISNPKGLFDKLGIKPGMLISVVGVEDAPFWAAARGNLVFGRVADESDMIFVPVNEPRDLEQLADLKRAIKPDGAVWAVFRKGRKDFNENDVLRGGLAAGLVDVKVVRFSDTHTASKFVIRKAERANQG
jgi:hypothetical protein